MIRKRRKWEESGEDDPSAGLVNLFDVWIAFAVALLLAIVSYDSVARKAPSPTAADGAPEMEAVTEQGNKLDRFRASTETKGGDGERLGTAYRLKSGEVIYVPDPPAPVAPRPGPGSRSGS
jgi:hypothetical protein